MVVGTRSSSRNWIKLISFFIFLSLAFEKKRKKKNEKKKKGKKNFCRTFTLFTQKFFFSPLSENFQP